MAACELVNCSSIELQCQVIMLIFVVVVDDDAAILMFVCLDRAWLLQSR